MSHSTKQIREFPALFMTALFVVASLAATGCLREMNNQQLPMTWSGLDDVQYYAPGPEFKLAREAAALKEQATRH